MKKFSYLLLNLGCRLNQAELTTLETVLQNLGGIANPSNPHLIILNTCAVTTKAERESRGMIRRLRRQHPQAKIIAWGCAAEKWLQEKKNWTKFGANYNWGNQNKTPNRHNIPSYSKKSPINFKATLTAQLQDILSNPLVPKNLTQEKIKGFYRPRLRRFIKIQDGCNHFCSYCLIPYLRKTSYSRPLPEILQEIREAVEEGVKEVILTGVDIADYHWEDKHLAQLISIILEKVPLQRLRLGSINPPAFKDESLIKILAENPVFLPHLHISLQSGSKKILQLMKRDYTPQEYLHWVTKLKSRVQNLLISTDVIVGFPGEGEKEFQETVDLIKKVKFSRLHIFPFSSRPGTLVTKLPFHPPQSKVIKQRVKILQQLNSQLQSFWQEYFQGQPLQVLWESYSQGFLRGWSENYLPWKKKGSPSEVGKIETIPYSWR